MRKHPYSRTPKQTITFNEETPRLIEGNLPLLPSEQESTLCRGIRKPIGELATQTDALRYPGTHEALQPAHLLPRPQGRKAALTLRATGRIECAQTLWGEGAKRFRRLFRGVRLVNQGREACAITHVTDVPSPWHACAIAVARLCHRGGTGVPAWWHNCANSMAHHWHHKVLLIKQLE